MTLFALHPDKHAGFHGFVKITTNSRFHVRNPRAAVSPSVIPPRRLLEWRRSTGHPRRAAHWNSNVNLEKVRAHIAERVRPEGRGEEEDRGAERSECGVLLVSLAMSKTVAGSRPCLLSNSVRWTGISSSKVVPPSCPSVLFYSHVGQANTSRFRGRSLLVTSAATSAQLALMCRRRAYNTTKGYKNTSTWRSGDKCSLCINRGWSRND